MSASRVSVVCIGVAVCLSCSDSHRYFRTEASAVEHFKNNQILFRESATRWQKLGDAESFSLDFSNAGGFSWNAFAFKPQGQLYQLIAGDGVVGSALTFDQAAARAGVGSEDLRWWLQTARQLQVCRVVTKGSGPPLQERYVQMYLRGSGTYGYGFLYAPTNNPRGWRGVIPDKLRIGAGPYLSRADVIADDWRYFEEVGPSGGSPEGHTHPDKDEEKR
jgi:hypothetical protein